MNSKTNKGFIILILITTAIVLGFTVYFFYPSSKNIVNSDSCLYQGISYSAGQKFKSDDGCNSCICEENQVSCTEMACQ